MIKWGRSECWPVEVYKLQCLWSANGSLVHKNSQNQILHNIRRLCKFIQSGHRCDFSVIYVSNPEREVYSEYLCLVFQVQKLIN